MRENFDSQKHKTGELSDRDYNFVGPFAMQVEVVRPYEITIPSRRSRELPTGTVDENFVGPFPETESIKPTISLFEDVRSYQDVPELVDDICTVVCSAFDKPDFDPDDIKAHINGDVVMVAYAGEKPLAFHTMQFGSPRDLLRDPSLPDRDGCYFAATAVAKEAQGQGIFRQINQRRFQIILDRGIDLVFARTQNPLVETGITHHLRRLEQQGSIQSFTQERRLLAGHYGQMLSAERPPRSADVPIQDAYDQLVPEKGDAYALLFALSV